MLTLTAYTGGAQDFTLLREPLGHDETQQLLFNTARLLVARNMDAGSIILTSYNWQIYPAQNGMGDEFQVLFASVPLSHYEHLRQHRTGNEVRIPFSQIRETINELLAETYVRFIACEFEQIQPPVDGKPSLLMWQLFILPTRLCSHTEIVRKSCIGN